jgi:hypothetical protein
MAVILKPRSNKQGVVDTSADLIKIEGRDNYTVLVKDLGVFEWIVSGTVDSVNIFAGKVGFWSRVLQSAEGLLAYTAEDQANKSTNIVTDAASDVKYPSVRATKQYADALVTGLLDDRGNFTPGLTSPGAWPTTGGSGTAGAIMKGDIWFCSASGFMGTTAVVAGSSFRATVDTPGQTAGNWNVLSAGAISTSTPSLQQVTDVGATTSTSVFISGASGGFVSTSSTSDSSAARVEAFSAQGGALRLVNATGGTTRLRNANATGSKIIQLPNAEGTLALTSDIGAEPYLVYTALISFDGSSVTATVLRNTLGQTVSWSNPGTGVFRGTSDVGDVFTTDKTFISTIGYNNGGQPMIVTGARGNLSPARRVEFRFFLHDGTIATTPLIDKHPVEIRVYP